MPTAGGDVIDSLLAQHQQIKFLFGQVLDAEGDYKQSLFDQLVALLAVHESVEASLVHPAAAHDLPDGEEVVPQRLAEEDEAKQALTELYELGVDDPDFNARLAVLRDDVATHAEAEEQLEFLRLRQTAPPEELLRLTGLMQAVAPLAVAGSGLDGSPKETFERARQAVAATTGGRS